MEQTVSTVRGSAVQVLAVVCPGHMVRAILLPAGRALLAGSRGVAALARLVLRADTDPVTHLQVTFGLGADAHYCTNNFVADAAGVGCRALEGY